MLPWPRVAGGILNIDKLIYPNKEEWLRPKLPKYRNGSQLAAERDKIYSFLSFFQHINLFEFIIKIRPI